MTSQVQRWLSWLIFAGLLGGLVWIAQAEMLRWHAEARLRTRTLQQSLALAQREAARLPARQAALAALRGGTPEAQVFWHGASPAAALLDLQEFTAQAAGTAGLSVRAIEAVRPAEDAPALLRITLRAAGSLRAVQETLLTLERHDPKITVRRARIEEGAETQGDPLLDLRLDLVGLHGSAEKLQNETD